MTALTTPQRIDNLTKVSLFFHDKITTSQGLCLLSIDDLVDTHRNPRKAQPTPMLISCANGVYTLHRNGKQFQMSREHAIRLTRLSEAYWWQGNPQGTWEYATLQPFSRFKKVIQ